MMVKGVMGLYLEQTLHISITNFQTVCIHLPWPQKVVKSTYVPVKIVYFKYEPYSYPSGKQVSSGDSPVNAVHNKSNPDRSKQMAEHENVKDEE